jgi:hypothetical protein
VTFIQPSLTQRRDSTVHPALIPRWVTLLVGAFGHPRGLAAQHVA